VLRFPLSSDLKESGNNLIYCNVGVWLLHKRGSQASLRGPHTWYYRQPGSLRGMIP